MSAVPQSVPTFGEIGARLADNGYRPVPIIVGKKRPPMDEWQKFSYSDADGRRYGNSYTGILCGEVCAVDIDILDPDACASVRELAIQMLGPAPERIGFPPKRLFAYRITSPIKKLQIIGEAGKVEILGDGQQFVAYAIHPDTGRPYEWVGYDNPLDTPLDRLPSITPEQVHAFLSRAAALMGAQDAGIQSSGFADGQEADERWGRAIAQVLAGGDLHDSLRNLAAGWIASGMPAPAAVQALRAVMENSAARKLRPRDWQARYEDIPRAVRSAQEKFEQAPSAATAADGSLLMSVLDLEQHSANVRWAVKHVIGEETVGMIFGASGAFKSFLAIDYAMHRCYGMDWLGKKTRKGNVVYLAAEGGAGLLRRIQAWHLARGMDWRQCPMATVTVPLTMKTKSAFLREQIIAAGMKATDVVIDTMSQTYTGNENSSDEVAEYFRVIGLELRAMLGVTVIVVHHSGHSASERPRGSSAIVGALDFVFGVFREEKERIATLTCLKQKDEDRFADVLFDLSVHEIGRDEDGDPITSLAAKHMVTGEEQAKALLREADAGRSSELAGLLQVAKDGMLEAELRSAFYKTLPAEMKQDTRKHKFYRTLDKAVAAGKLVVDIAGGRVVRLIDPVDNFEASNA